MADDIRACEQAYVEAATAAFRKRFAMEYFRLRGYAVESGKSAITLSVQVICDFHPSKRLIIIESSPVFQPEFGSTQVRAAVSHGN